MRPLLEEAVQDSMVTMVKIAEDSVRIHKQSLTRISMSLLTESGGGDQSCGVERRSRSRVESEGDAGDR